MLNSADTPKEKSNTAVEEREPETITLPQLEIRSIRHSIGRIYHVLDTGSERRIEATHEVSISARKKATVLKLDNGQSVIITDQKGIKRPADVDGILYRSGGLSKWVSHKKLDEFPIRDMPREKDTIYASWKDAFRFRSEVRGSNGKIISQGLRPPQIGGLHSIGAHWSIDHQLGTIVMPTGTGKTETMIASMIAYASKTVLVVVPWIPLRDQTLQKYSKLGLLRALESLLPSARNPIVGVIEKRPTKASDLDIFDKCNVVIAAMPSLTQKMNETVMRKLAERVDVLLIDEAHHVASHTWTTFREYFSDKKIVQFTATPFRRDGKLVDGQVLFSYPLRKAQRDGYFKKIFFKPIFEIDNDEADRAIAAAAIAKLREDRAADKDHIVMARCADTKRAKQVYAIYRTLGAEFDPQLIHSGTKNTAAALAKLRSGQSRIVVCVYMLGEGFDLPTLKIAALHDPHRSLAITLQFTGRFTRTAGPSVGDATVIANIADQRISDALERLYSEDADWNELLSEFSSQAVKDHAQLIEFLSSSARLGSDGDKDNVVVSPQLLRPKFSAVVYHAQRFEPKQFFKGLPSGVVVKRVWLHEPSKTLYFVTVLEEVAAWSQSRQIRDRAWHLFVLHYDEANKLLYLHSSDKSSTHLALAQAVSGADASLISGDQVFRSLGGINRLLFQNIGVKKHGRRNLRYAMYTGADVKEALSIAEKAGSVKSNLYGWGYENGQMVTIGCSYKGRIWCRDSAPIPKLLDWCATIGSKLLDVGIDTTKIIDNVLIPEEVSTLPGVEAFSIEWPIELWEQSEDRISLSTTEHEIVLSLISITLDRLDRTANRVHFNVSCEHFKSSFALALDATNGFVVSWVSGPTIQLKAGRINMPLENYLSDYPPLVRFVDLSELDGNLLIKPKDTRELSIADERFEVWDWRGTDITVESIWRKGNRRDDSIQERVAKHYAEGGFTVVFDDDDSGEAADLVCFKEEDDHIRLALVHCKFSGGQTPGERVKDVSEVCSQAVRSTKWVWRFRELANHILDREKRLKNNGRDTRFLQGDATILSRFVKKSRFKRIQAEIVIAQPGLSVVSRTVEQKAVLAAACSFIKETVGVDLDIICSK